MANEPKPWNVGAAIGVGQVWVTGAAFLAGILPIAVLALVVGDRPIPLLDHLGFWGVIIVPVALAILFLVPSWLVWSSQITLWRLWAYRRVDDVAALKDAANGLLIWPDGHVFERTEFRSRRQAEELRRLEQSSADRTAAREMTGETHVQPRTVVGTLLGATFWSSILAIPCWLGPVGLLMFLGVDIVESPFVWLAFPALVIAGLVIISAVAMRNGMTADQTVRRLLPGLFIKDDNTRQH